MAVAGHKFSLNAIRDHKFQTGHSTLAY